MTHINRTALVAYPAKNMYDLVTDIRSYPEFLPWCSAAEILEHGDDLGAWDGEGRQLASVTISKGPLKSTFTTRNTLRAPASVPVATDGEIRMQLVDGPFRHLDGYWHFRALSDEACKVEMDMEFEFAVGPAGMLLKPVFTHICTTLLNAFIERADTLGQ